MINPYALLILNDATIETKMYGNVDGVDSIAVKEYHLNEGGTVYECITNDGKVWVSKADVENIVEINQ